MVFAGVGGLFILAMSAPSTLYVVSQRAAYRDWPRRIVCLPALIMIGVGVACSNTRAVFEALCGKESEFIRTPKKGDREIKRYRKKTPWLAFFELALGAYCAYSLGHYLLAGKYLIGPFLAIYSAGFLFVGMLTILHSLGFDAISAKADSVDKPTAPKP
jgi:hypothetical protein